MRTYNQASQDIMPLMMNFTNPTTISDEQQIPFVYNDMDQTTGFNMRIVGTRSLRHHGTTRRGGKVVRHSDPKNEVDDSKTVR
mgnify:CR=1 FL=1